MVVFAKQLGRISYRFELKLLICIEVIFKTLNRDQVEEFKDFKNVGLPGFASLYLWRCQQESKSDDEKDIELYKKLLELDSRLDTTAAEQLFCCVHLTLRWDFIKVRISSGDVIHKSISVDRYGRS